MSWTFRVRLVSITRTEASARLTAMHRIPEVSLSSGLYDLSAANAVTLKSWCPDRAAFVVR